jgi:uncharacterized membrane protein
VDGSDWLLALHVSGAFLFLGGGVLAGALAVLAQRSERPSEIALFLGLTRVAVVAVVLGALATLILGFALVGHERDISFGETWVWLSLVLWVASVAAGQAGGKRDRETRLLAERLARETNVATAELRARLRDPVALSLSWGSGLAVVAILALMIWQPGS